MVIFVFGNYVSFFGKCCKAVVSWCKSKGADIAAVQGGCLFELVLPGQLDVVVLGDAGVAVLMLLLLRHGPLYPMLW